MERPPPRSTPPDTLFPSTTLLRSDAAPADRAQHHPISQVDHHHALSRPTSTCGRGDRDLPVARHLHHVAHRHLVIVCIRHSLYAVGVRSEEHTSELQSLMRISYAVFCLKKKKNNTIHTKNYQ